MKLYNVYATITKKVSIGSIVAETLNDAKQNMHENKVMYMDECMLRQLSSQSLSVEEVKHRTDTSNGWLFY